jgi:hypothetical protein
MENQPTVLMTRRSHLHRPLQYRSKCNRITSSRTVCSSPAVDKLRAASGRTDVSTRLRAQHYPEDFSRISGASTDVKWYHHQFRMVTRFITVETVGLIAAALKAKICSRITRQIFSGQEYQCALGARQTRMSLRVTFLRQRGDHPSLSVKSPQCRFPHQPQYSEGIG